MLQYFKVTSLKDVLLILVTFFILLEIVCFVQQIKRNIKEDGEFERILTNIGISFNDFWVIRHAHINRETILKLRENSCKIPVLNPFAPKMMKYFKPSKVDCGEKEFFFKSHVQDSGSSNTISESMILTYREKPPELRCCYEQLHFAKKFKYKALQNDECIFIAENKTVVPSDSEYLIVKCWNATQRQKGMSRNITNAELQAFLPNHQELLFYVPKPPLEILLQKEEQLMKQKEAQGQHEPDYQPLNVIIIGFDQISRSNFVRLMPKTFDYLKDDLNALDLQGFNKMGDATLNNTLAMLTGHDFASVKKKRWFSEKEQFFDECPWIWKNYSEKGYITAYADDYTSVLNYRFNGFREQPTDYYLEPFLQWYHNNKMVRWDTFGTYHCIGNELALDLLHDHAKKVAAAVGSHPYFQFLWFSRIHERAGYPALADKSALRTLKNFHSTGVLNRSLVILVSDHGWRAGPMMMEHQARLENRLSFAFLLLPAWFRERYELAYKNLQENQYRLTSPYDIHATLEDILNPTGLLSDDILIKRSIPPNTTGSSLFLPLSKERSCAEAGIDDEWCACINYEPFAADSPIIRQLATYAVATINSWLVPFPRCEQYKLDKVLSAEVKRPYHIIGDVSSPKTSLNFQEKLQFRISLSVLPSHKGAVFEVTIFTDGDYWQSGSRDQISMSTEVFRLNNYNSASCMPVYSLKKICTCTKKRVK